MIYLINIIIHIIAQLPVDVKSSTYIDSRKQINPKILNLKLVILLEYQNVKTFFLIGLKTFS